MTRRNRDPGLALGIFGILVLNAAVIAGFAFLSPILGSISLFGGFLAIGLVQLIYVIPICIQQSRRGHPEFVKGIVIGAIITALLNGGCWLLVLSATR